MNEVLDILGFDPSQLTVFAKKETANKKVNVYLAGKIEPNGWRQKIFDMRNSFIDDEVIPHLDNITISTEWDKNIQITGPFFLSCDHSCYHGERNHGLGIHAPVSCITGGRTHTGNEVINICKKQIERCDVLFAYINDDTCYGSLFEIGWAKALGKKIITIFDNTKRMEDMWFISKNSDYSISLDVYELKKTNPDLYNKIMDKLDYLYNPIFNNDFTGDYLSIPDLAYKLIDRLTK